MFFSNSRMGNFEQELFTVVDAILGLLGQKPSVTRTTSAQDHVTIIDRSPGAMTQTTKQSLSLAFPRFSPSCQLADAALDTPLESQVKRPCVAELVSDWTVGI